MAVAGGKMNIFKSYHTEISPFSRKTAKSTYQEKVSTSSIKPSYECIKYNLIIGEQVPSRNISSPEENLIKPLPIEPCLTDKSPIIESNEPSGLPIFETTPNSEVQTSETLLPEDIQKYYCPYLEHVASIDPSGQPYSDPKAKMKEIIEEMKLWEAEDIPNLDNSPKQNSPKLIKRESSVHDKDKSGNSTKNVNKLKVDCPNCKKKVVAVRFVFHLSKCMGVNGRQSSRQSRKK